MLLDSRARVRNECDLMWRFGMGRGGHRERVCIEVGEEVHGYGICF
jgi:hypothetical protein